jgi:hypothetical protein
MKAERSRNGRHREGLRGEYELQSVDMAGGRVDDGMDGKSRERIEGEEANGYQEMENSRTAGTCGTTSSTTNTSHGRTTNTAPFSPSAFPKVPDILPYTLWATTATIIL